MVFIIVVSFAAAVADQMFLFLAGDPTDICQLQRHSPPRRFDSIPRAAATTEHHEVDA